MSTDFTPSANWLSHEYRDLNGTAIETLEEPPSALEFMRLVHISRPVIIKGYQFPALNLWNEEYLGEKMGDRQVSVAVTPNGLADSITRGPDGRLYFVEPSVDKMSMKELLSKLGPNRIDTGEICYLQSQNGNLFASDSSYNPESDPSSSDFEPLTSDVPRDVPWCSDALGEHPDAVNLWIGDERSITSIHSDPYENIYTVVRGEKHFFLLPPTDSWCLKESLYPHANYSRRSPLGTLELIPSPEDVPEVRWSSILDPELPTALPKEVVPIRVTLHAGETLYLPVGWWHYVQQSGLTIALNWWYDAEMRGMSWVLLNFLRNPVQLPSGNGDSIAQLAPS